MDRYLTPEEIAKLPVTHNLLDAAVTEYFESQQIELQCLTSDHLIEFAQDVLQAGLQKPESRQTLIDADSSLRSLFVECLADCLDLGTYSTYFRLMSQCNQGLPARAYAESLGKPWQPR